MIITRTPFRMSYVGGGTDIANFYRQEQGAVISTAIDKFMYITLHDRFEKGIRVAYSKTEEVETIDQLEHPLVREALRIMNINSGIEITSTADIPGKGTGLGSSSSYTVGLLKALHAYCSRPISNAGLADMACRIEIEKCGEPIGKQDQYAASFGGLKLYEFLSDERVNVTPVVCSKAFETKLNAATLVFYTGNTRSASGILHEQTKNSTDSQKVMSLRRMAGLAYDFKHAIEAGNFPELGELLKENWALKKTLANGISNDLIDTIYQEGIGAGAIGGKLLGAGSGGFMMFLAEPRYHDAIASKLSQFRKTQFNIEKKGSEVVYHD